MDKITNSGGGYALIGNGITLVVRFDGEEKPVSVKTLPVYKFFCFGGEPRIVQAIQNDKQPNESIDYFDAEWNRLLLRQNFPNSENPLPAPKTLRQMLQYARQLSVGHPFLRVDFYEVNGRIYFSEFTFFSDGGTARFDPPEWDRTLGAWIKLPEK